MRDVCVVFGTYNRLGMLKNAVASVRKAAQGLTYHMAIVDGGSTDGTREWLSEQDDVVLICQKPPLTGAVRAFNLGFAHAVDVGYKYVFHFNDDAEIVTEEAFKKAILFMDDDPKIGEVAFEFDLRGSWAFEYVNTRLYANFGLIRLEAGIQVAKEQGDATGRLWWNPIYRTYGADSEFGVHLWRLGWKVHPGINLRVHDLAPITNDELRHSNECYNPDRRDSKLFWERWRHWA